jgi:hypothetical protein
MIIFLPLFIITISVLAYLRKRSTRAQEDAENAFWAREQEANNTRRKDISNLPYISIPLEKFPTDICDDEAVKSCEATLTELSHEKILNLGRQTNTDLKLAYGAANLTELSVYGENFNRLCRTLTDYAKALCACGHDSDAIPVLEFAVSCGSDSSATYELLANLYEKAGRKDSISTLLATARGLDSIMRDSIVRKLEEKCQG